MPESNNVGWEMPHQLINSSSSKGLPLEVLAEITDFVYFVRKRLVQPQAFEEEIRSTLLREELRHLRRDEEVHVEQKFANYDQLTRASEKVDLVAIRRESW
jgi:hypothetical protein